MNKTLIIGDIHGCFDELIELVKMAEISASDRIIALGDIIDRGPEPRKVLDFFINMPNARTILGNHERKHVLVASGNLRPALSQRITKCQLGGKFYREALNYFQELPWFLNMSEALLIHAFLEPQTPLSQQKKNVIVGTLQGEKYMRKNYRWPWYQYYKGNKPLVFGHLSYGIFGKPVVKANRIYGIDTGCYQNGYLTGVLLPEQKVIQVKSKENYWDKVKNYYQV